MLFTIIVRACWILLAIVPLALAAFNVPGVNAEWLTRFGAGGVYGYAAFGLVPAICLLMFVTLAQKGSAESFRTVGQMLSINDKHTIYTRLYLIGFITSAVILSLAVENYGAAVTLSASVLANILTYGHAESVRDKLIMTGAFRGATRTDADRKRESRMSPSEIAQSKERAAHRGM